MQIWRPVCRQSENQEKERKHWRIQTMMKLANVDKSLGMGVHTYSFLAEIFSKTSTPLVKMDVNETLLLHLLDHEGHVK